MSRTVIKQNSQRNETGKWNNFRIFFSKFAAIKFFSHFHLQYCLSGDPAKPCYLISFKELLIMLDCGLTSQTVLNFLPLPLVQSSRFQSLPNWICPRDHDAQADGELKECCNRIFIDSPPEFNAPLDKIVDFSEIDVILISNYMNMLALPFITGKLLHSKIENPF